MEKRGMRDGQRVAFNASLMMFKHAVMAVLGVVFVGYMARRVGLSDWGEFQASLAVASMVTVVAGVGVRGYLAREVAVRPELGPRHLGSALAIRGVTGTVLLGATVLVMLVLRSGLGASLVALAAASQLATLLYSTMWLSFEAHERFQYILYAEVGARLCVIGLATALLLVGFGVVAAATAFLLGNVLELLITYYFVRTRLYRPRFDAPRSELVRIARRSLPIGMCGAITGALHQTDRVLLRALCDESAVGIYSAAWVLSDNFTLIPDLFLGASFAAGMRLFARDRQKFAELYRSAMLVAVVLGLPIAVGVCVVAPEIVSVVYRAEGYVPAAAVLRVLVCQVPIAFVFQVGTLPLLAAKREVTLVKLLAGTLLANVALNLLLVPHFRAIGAAAATVAAATGALLVSAYLTREWFSLVSPSRVARVGAATALMLCVAYPARQVGGMWLAAALGAASYSVALLAFRALSIHELSALARRRVPSSASPA